MQNGLACEFISTKYKVPVAITFDILTCHSRKKQCISA